jgi:hypothetical protein
VDKDRGVEDTVGVEVEVLDSVVLQEPVTPDFPKKTKCLTICMPGSSFIHIVTS